MIRCAFDKQVVSNFCDLDAAQFSADGCAVGLKFSCVEALFQYVKIVLSDDDVALKRAVENAEKPSEIKKAGGNVKILDEWFYKSTIYGDPVSWITMEYAQAWAATCLYHFNVLKQLMQEAVDMGVDPLKVYFHEHNGDKIYGTGCNPQDFKVLFEPDFTPPQDGDVMGKALTKAARKVWELQYWNRYVEWFKDTYPPLFVLKRP